jgi:hypothetical protein
MVFQVGKEGRMSSTFLGAGNEKGNNNPQGATSENQVQFATYHQDNSGAPQKLGTTNSPNS